MSAASEIGPLASAVTDVVRAYGPDHLSLNRDVRYTMRRLGCTSRMGWLATTGGLTGTAKPFISFYLIFICALLYSLFTQDSSAE